MVKKVGGVIVIYGIFSKRPADLFKKSNQIQCISIF